MSDKPGGMRAALRGLADSLWAGLLGASFGMTGLGLLLLLARAGLISLRDDRDVLLFGGLGLLSLMVTLTRGFRAPARGVGRLLGRAAGALVAGGVIFAAQFALLLVIADLFHINDREISVVILVTGIPLVIALLRRARRLARREPAVDAPMARGDTRITPYLWAGLFGAALFGWFVGVVISFDSEGLLPIGASKLDSLVLVGAMACVVIASSRAFPREIRASVSLFKLLFLTVFFGALTAVLLALVLFGVEVVLRLGRDGMMPLVIALAIPLIALALVKGRDILAEGTRGRIEAGVFCVLLVGLGTWPQSPWLRYAFGSAEGSRKLADDHYRRNDHARASVFFDVACERGDAQACLMGAHLHASGLGTRPSPKRARELIGLACREAEECMELLNESDRRAPSHDLLLTRACELGSKQACTDMRRKTLEGRCEYRDAYACREMAGLLRGENRNSSDYAAQVYLRRACEYGDRTACEGAPSP